MNNSTDLDEFLEKAKYSKPPYKCPVVECGRVYRSYMGVAHHMRHFDHDDPESYKTPVVTKPAYKRRAGFSTHTRRRFRKSKPFKPRSAALPIRSDQPKRETMTWAEAQRLVEVEVDGKLHRISIYEPLTIMSESDDEPDNLSTPARPPPEPFEKSAIDFEKLPKAVFRIVDDYVKPGPAPPQPDNYFRYVEKTELDQEVEYDMDDEDHAWLELVNDMRKKDKGTSVAQDTFEFLMDRFEKEAFFQSQTTGKSSEHGMDDDAVCSICLDGDCQNTNVILFCDLCNIAVHQECYGVPYIPEGQWLCRRCLQSPSEPVNCCLCPNKGGAFKQTSDGRWAHVVCAFWIPEAGFANTAFLEPVDGIESIPSARWRLTCYICKQRQSGACIQCHKANCYTAFHVTCAQQAGLYMYIEPVRGRANSGGATPGASTAMLKKSLFCDAHDPISGKPGKPSSRVNDSKEKHRQKMRKARKMLADKRNTNPVVNIPMIPAEKLEGIAKQIKLKGKQQFIRRMYSYWTLKRLSRYGVPLLRRLQACHTARPGAQLADVVDTEKVKQMKEKLKFWQRLRQDLEKARLLVELIRKREKIKREAVQVEHLLVERRLSPLTLILREAIIALQEKDTTKVFSDDVDTDDVTDYLDIIKKPMSFATMHEKIEAYEYINVSEFIDDFRLMIDNCMLYNKPTTPYYKSAVRVRDNTETILDSLVECCANLDPGTGTFTELPPGASLPAASVESGAEADSDATDESTTSHRSRSKDSTEAIKMEPDVKPGDDEALPLEQQLSTLLDKIDRAEELKGKKSKLVNDLKDEVVKIRSQLALVRPDSRMTSDQSSTSGSPRAATATPAALELKPRRPLKRNTKSEDDENLSDDDDDKEANGKGAKVRKLATRKSIDGDDCSSSFATKRSPARNEEPAVRRLSRSSKARLVDDTPPRRSPRIGLSPAPSEDASGGSSRASSVDAE